MSSFAGLQTAYSGLTAAQRAMQVAGHNISNVNVAGYTRQRVELASVGGPSPIGRLSAGSNVSQGVTVTDVVRLGNAQLDARVRGSAGLAAQTETLAAGLDGIEQVFREPGDNGLSALLSAYWNAWDDVASYPGEAPAASVLFESAQSVADRLGQMHAELSGQYRGQHQQLRAHVSDINTHAAAVAKLNGQIRDANASGSGSGTNELMDERDRLTLQLAELTGAEVRNQADGTAEVLIGGTHLVSGTTARSLRVEGTAELTHTDGVHLAWSHRPEGSAPATISGGTIAGNLAMLATDNEGGGGGPIAATAATLNAIAQNLADSVNEAHAQGRTTSGQEGGAFWALGPGAPAASLQVAISRADQIAVAAPGGGALDGHNASSIAELGGTNDGPDAQWSALVAGVGTQLRNAAMGSVNASTAYVSALESQRAQSAVSLDEENVSLLQNQYAYQGAARVMTAIDQMLDTLINRTGLVGR